MRSSFRSGASASTLRSAPSELTPYRRGAAVDSRAVGNLLEGVLTWLVERLDQFDPWPGNAELDVLRSKALGELAFFCHYFRLAGRGPDERVERMMDAVEQIWRRPHYQELLIRQPEDLQLFLLTYHALVEFGRVDQT